ncbi:hypothetical protein CDL15_Pgr025827 [Punica granatum]|uniref:Uncharacterized protein n=1 Tax=Punica granatum TaxID=22663 RepID=A0A218WBZ3_PUNGR|nr:hypothetical protein CDL15_Pgr025827 [Punica granatum]
MTQRRTLRGTCLTSAIEALTGSNVSRDVAVDDCETRPPDTPLESMEEVPPILTEPSVRRQERTSVADIWNLPPGERIIIETEEYGQPVDKEASLLFRVSGTIGRSGNMCPLDIIRRGKVPNHAKDNILKTEHAQPLKECSKRFRNNICGKLKQFELNKHIMEKKFELNKHVGKKHLEPNDELM